jgi:hypothetical protein
MKLLMYVVLRDRRECFTKKNHFFKCCADYLLQNFNVSSLRSSVRTYHPVIILKEYCSRKA